MKQYSIQKVSRWKSGADQSHQGDFSEVAGRVPPPVFVSSDIAAPLVAFESHHRLFAASDTAYCVRTWSLDQNLVSSCSQHVILAATFD
jgi:hypothetical protein